MVIKFAVVMFALAPYKLADATKTVLPSVVSPSVVLPTDIKLLVTTAVDRFAVPSVFKLPATILPVTERELKVPMLVMFG